MKQSWWEIGLWFYMFDEFQGREKLALFCMVASMGSRVGTMVRQTATGY